MSAAASTRFELSSNGDAPSATSSDGPTVVPDHEALHAWVGACSWEPSTSVTLKARPLELDSLRALAMSAAIELDSDFGQHLARGLQPRSLPRIDPSTIETVRPPSRRAPAESGNRVAASVAKAPHPQTKSRSNLARVS